jgi:large subunit ribosomal protein L5
MKHDSTTKTLMKELSLSNRYAVPRIDRVVVSAGVGKKRDDAAFIAAVQKDLRAICGQQVHERRARKAVAGFNVRAGDLVGYRATLRGKRRDDFIKRFVHTTLPRVRDFRGLNHASLDGHGNLSVGLPEQLAFPEIHPEKTDVVFGVEVTFVTTAQNDAAGEALFRALGFPLKGSDS